MIFLILINKYELEPKTVAGLFIVLYGFDWFFHILTYYIRYDKTLEYPKWIIILLPVFMTLGIMQMCAANVLLVTVLCETGVFIVFTTIALIIELPENKQGLLFILSTIVCIGGIWALYFNKMILSEYILLIVVFTDFFLEAIFGIIEVGKKEQIALLKEEIKALKNLKEGEDEDEEI